MNMDMYPFDNFDGKELEATMNKNKYNAQIFPNGHVIIFEQSILDEAIEKGKEILLVCVNTDGGYAYAIGVESYAANGCNLYGHGLYNTLFTSDEVKRFHAIIIDEGEEVIMKTGSHATAARFNRFVDDKSEIENPNDELFRKMIDEENTVKNLSKYYNDEGDPDIEDWKERVWALIRYHIVSEDALKYCKV
mgnify:FL=1